MEPLEILIEIVGVGVSFGALTLIYFTLQEMQNQRRATYQPEVAVKHSNRVYLWWREDSIDSVWKTKLISFKELESTENDEFIRLFNVGLGTANNVKIFWKYDSDKLIEKINELKNFIQFELDIQKVENKLKFLAISRENPQLKRGQWIDMENEFAEEYILPINVDTNTTMVFIPKDYLFLVSILFFFTFQKYKRETAEFLIDVPPLKFKLKYEDIGGYKRHKSFVTILKAPLILTHPGDRLTMIGMDFGIKEISATDF